MAERLDAIIRRSGGEGLIPRWLNPRLAEALEEHIPAFGTLTLTFRNSQLTDQVQVTQSHRIDTRKDAAR